MNKHTILVAGALSLSLLLGNAVWADNHGKGEGSKSDKMHGSYEGKKAQRKMDRMIKKLELTEEQQAQFDAIMAEAQAQHEEMMQQRQMHRDAMHAKISEILTPEQAEKFNEMHERHGNKERGKGGMKH